MIGRKMTIVGEMYLLEMYTSVNMVLSSIANSDNC